MITVPVDHVHGAKNVEKQPLFLMHFLLHQMFFNVNV